jgi:hypothetical protein
MCCVYLTYLIWFIAFVCVHDSCYNMATFSDLRMKDKWRELDKPQVEYSTLMKLVLP